MAEIPVRVDPGRLRTLADRMSAAADAIAEIRCPGPPFDGLAGSAVASAAEPRIAEAKLDAVIVAMSVWATGARSAARALADADEHNAGRM